MAGASDGLVGPNSDVDDTTTVEFHLRCFSCLDLYDENALYHCGTCDTSEKEISDKNYICEGCIFPHIKQKHDVLDKKGYPPAICEKHRLLSTYFCYDCEQIFCIKDFEDHCQHEFKSVSEKALEVKKTVFEYLNKFDAISKPLAARKNLAQNILQKNEELYPNLGSDSFMDDLSSRFDRIIRTGASKWVKLAEGNFEKMESKDSIFSLSEQVDNELTSLRKLLTMSDGVCVTKFLSSKSDFDFSLEKQKSELEAHVVVEWCDSLDNQIEHSINNLLRSWKLSGVSRFKWKTLGCTLEPPRFLCSKNELSHALFNISILPDQVVFSNFEPVQLQNVIGPSISWLNPFSPATVYRRPFGIGDVVSVIKCQNLVAFQGEDYSVDVFDLHSQEYCDGSDIASSRNILKFEGADDGIFTFICWNASKLAIECLVDFIVNWELYAMSKPKLFASHGSVIAFTEENNKLTLHNLATNLKVEILPRHHGFTRIDNLVIEDSVCALFDYKWKTVLLTNFSLKCGVQLEWVVKNLYKIDCTEDIHFMSVCGESILVCTEKEVYRCTLPS